MRSIIILPLMGLGLVGCANTVSFEKTTSLAVPAKITARVDPALWRLEEHREMWDTTGVMQVGQALAWILADDPQALTYVSSRFTPMGGFAIAFYDPNLYEVAYTLRLALERDGQRQLVEGRGRAGGGDPRVGQRARTRRRQLAADPDAPPAENGLPVAATAELAPQHPHRPRGDRMAAAAEP
jgi:hypothetical protein